MPDGDDAYPAYDLYMPGKRSAAGHEC